MVRIRQCTRSDLPAVAELRPKAFTHSRWPDAGALAAQFDRVLFESPWAQPGLGGWLAEEGGRIVGFTAAVPRSWQLEARELTGGVVTQIMVDPGYRGRGIARALLQAIMQASPDLLVLDAPVPATRRMLRQLGWIELTATRFRWWRTLRPVGARLRPAEARLQPAARVLTPFVKGLDAAATRVFATRVGPLPPDDGRPAALEPAIAASELSALLDGNILRRTCTAESWVWLLARIRDKWGQEPVARVVLGKEGSVLGWFIYVMHEGTAITYELAASRDTAMTVFRHLTHDAWAQGARILSGRYEPIIWTELGSAPVQWWTTGESVYVHAAHPELLRTLAAGRAFLTGLDGEWWLAF